MIRINEFRPSCDFCCGPVENKTKIDAKMEEMMIPFELYDWLEDNRDDDGIDNVNYEKLFHNGNSIDFKDILDEIIDFIQTYKSRKNEDEDEMVDLEAYVIDDLGNKEAMLGDAIETQIELVEKIKQKKTDLVFVEIKNDSDRCCEESLHHLMIGRNRHHHNDHERNFQYFAMSYYKRRSCFTSIISSFVWKFNNFELLFNENSIGRFKIFQRYNRMLHRFDSKGMYISYIMSVIACIITEVPRDIRNIILFYIIDRKESSFLFKKTKNYIKI